MQAIASILYFFSCSFFQIFSVVRVEAVPKFGLTAAGLSNCPARLATHFCIGLDKQAIV